MQKWLWLLCLSVILSAPNASKANCDNAICPLYSMGPTGVGNNHYYYALRFGPMPASCSDSTPVGWVGPAGTFCSCSQQPFACQNPQLLQVQNKAPQPDPVSQPEQEVTDTIAGKYVPPTGINYADNFTPPPGGGVIFRLRETFFVRVTQSGGSREEKYIKVFGYAVTIPNVGEKTAFIGFHCTDPGVNAFSGNLAPYSFLTGPGPNPTSMRDRQKFVLVTVERVLGRPPIEILTRVTPGHPEQWVTIP